MSVGFDQVDALILSKKIEEREKIKGPRVGDVVIRIDSIAPHRIAYMFDDKYQLSSGGSFFLDSNGNADFSGSLDYPRKYELKMLLRECEHMFWFFHHDEPGAHRGVNCFVKCRVFVEVE